MKRLALCSVVCLLLAGMVLAAPAKLSVEFAGMTLEDLSPEFQAAMEEEAGRAVGLMVVAVEEDSLADKTGIVPGDVLISIQEPHEEEFLPFPCNELDAIGEWADETKPTTEMNVLLIREVDGEWTPLAGPLGTPLEPEAGPDGMARNPDDIAPAHSTANYNFVTDDPSAVLATAQDGSPLTALDVDIFGGMIAWALNTRLTEAQKQIVAQSMAFYWTMAGPAYVQAFDEGVRSAPEIIPQLDENMREQYRQDIAGVLAQMVQMDPQAPLSQVIMQVAMSGEQILAGEGTQFPLTLQDVNAMLEYNCFQLEQMTGMPVVVTEEEYMQFAQQLVEQYNAGSDEQKVALSQADVTWGMVRAAWIQASQEMQQQQVNDWALAYAGQYPEDQYLTQYLPGQDMYGGGGDPGAYWGSGATGGSGYDPGSMAIMQNMIDMEHQTSMGIINNMGDGAAYDVYDSAGNWLYDY